VTIPLRKLPTETGELGRKAPMPVSNTNATPKATGQNAKCGPFKNPTRRPYNPAESVAESPITTNQKPATSPQLS
jgi:hypothetical protein